MAMFSPSMFSASPMFSTGTTEAVVSGWKRAERLKLKPKNKIKEDTEMYIKFFECLMKTRGR